MNFIRISALIQVILCSISLTLHLIALLTTHWAIFSAKTDLGLPEEVGHYGIWGLCSIKAPLYRDDCDPLDTFFRPPHHMMSAGVVASIQSLVSLVFLTFIAIRLQQIKRNKPNFLIKTKTVNTIKLSLITISSLLVAITLLLTTLPETASREQIIFHTSTLDNYHTWKGWSFWLEFTVCLIDILIVVLCVVDNNSKPTSMSRFDITSEYFNPYFQRQSHSNRESNSISTISDTTNDGWIDCNSHDCQLFNKAYPNLPFHSISFNNPTFLSESPDLRRQSKPISNHFEFI